jgi:hypothetical protein
MAAFTTIAAYSAFGLAIVNSSVSLGNLWRGAQEAVRSDQRTLRQQLREVLLDVQKVCAKDAHRFDDDLHFPEVVPNELGEAAGRVKEIRVGALLMSPNDTHLALLQGAFSFTAGHWLQPVKGPFRDNISNPDLEDAALKFKLTYSYVLTVINRYLAVLAKIDKGSYITYFRYKNSDAKKPEDDAGDYWDRLASEE